MATGASTEISLRLYDAVIKDRTPLYGQFSYMDGMLSLPNAYPVLSVYEAGRGWWQVTDHPQGDAVFSETAFYTVSITAPPKLIVAASGSEVDLAGQRGRHADSPLRGPTHARFCADGKRNLT